MEPKFKSLWIVWIIGVVVVLMAGACVVSELPKCRPGPDECEIGSEGCSCTAGGACDAELACTRGLCEAPDSTTNEASTTSTDTEPSDLPYCMEPVHWR